MSQISDETAQVKEFINRNILDVFFVVIIFVFGAALFFGVRSYKGKLNTADVAYKKLQAIEAEHSAVIKTDTEERTAQTKALQAADLNTAARDHKSDLLKAAVTAPRETTEQVQADSDKYLNLHGIAAPDGTFVFNKEAVQGFIATKIDDTEVNQDKLDLTVKDNTLQDEVTSSEKDLALCQSDGVAKDKVIVDYKKAASSSKWGKALDYTEKAGLLLGGLYVGYKVGQLK